MKQTSIAAFTFILAVIFFSNLPLLYAKTFTVGKDEKYTSIQAVFDQEDLEPGDTIEVQRGVYHEQVVWGSDDDGDSTAYVTLMAKPNERVIITGDRTREYCIRLADRHYCRIIGIECIQALHGISIYKGDHYYIRNCTSHDHDQTLGTYAVGIRISGVSHAIVNKCRVYDVAWNGIKINAEEGCGDSTDFTIEKCDVSAGHTSIDLRSSTNCALQNITIRRNKLHGKAGIYTENTTLKNVSDIKIYYNLFATCKGAHIATQTRPGDTSNPFTLWKIYNNTFDKSGTETGNSHLEFLSGLTNSEIKNNIFSRANYSNINGQTKSIRFSNDVTNLVLDYNCYYSLYTENDNLINWNGTAYKTLSAFNAATGQEPHGIEQNPLLKSNYKLSPQSSCIDKGIILSIHTGKFRDYIGTKKIYGDAPDIGCIETRVKSSWFWGILPWSNNQRFQRIHSVTLQWDRNPDVDPNTGARTTGYNLYYSHNHDNLSSGNFDYGKNTSVKVNQHVIPQPIDDSNTVTYTWRHVPSGNYYFVCTAYDKSTNKESTPSNIVHKTIK